MSKDYKQIPMNVYRHFMHDSLYRNSIFLILNTVATSVIGFVFWTIAARIYEPSQVGLASAIIAATGFLASISYLGFDYTLIKYIPRAKSLPTRLGTAFTITCAMNIFVAIVYLILTPYFFNSFEFLISTVAYILLFIFLIVMTTWNGITNSVLIAFKVAQFVAIATLIAGLFKISLVVLLNNYDKEGLLLAHLVAVTASVLLSFVFIKKVSGYIYKPIVSQSEISTTARFSAANYFAAIAGSIPILVLPIIIIHYLGAEQAAYFYIVTMVVALLNVISQATTQSLFAHGSWNDNNIARQTRKAFMTIMAILIPSILLVIIVGRFGLSIFGEEYSKYGYALLVVLSLSTIPKVVSQLSSTLLRIRDKTNLIIIITSINSLIVVSLSALGLSMGYGLVYVGWAILISEIISACLHLIAHNTSLKFTKLH